MPSVMGLLEERERAARQRVEVLQVELGEAEAVWERFVIARETVGQILAEPRGSAEESSLAGAGERPVQIVAAGPVRSCRCGGTGLRLMRWRRTTGGS